MQAGHFGGLDDLLVGYILIKPGNVVANGAFEKQNLLRQISDIPSPIFTRPPKNISTIHAHYAGCRLFNAGDQACERCFPGGRWANYSNGQSRFDFKRYARQDRSAQCPDFIVNILYREMPFWFERENTVFRLACDAAQDRGEIPRRQPETKS